MPLTVEWAGDKKSYSTPEEGRYVAKIVGVERVMGTKYQSTDEEPQFQIGYETLKETDENGEPFRFRQWINIGKGYDPSNEKAHMTKFINGVFGRAFIKEQIQQLDWEKLVGSTVAVMIEHTASGNAKVIKVSVVKGRELSLNDVVMEGADRKVSPPSTSSARKPAETDDELDDPFDDQ